MDGPTPMHIPIAQIGLSALFFFLNNIKFRGRHGGKITEEWEKWSGSKYDRNIMCTFMKFLKTILNYIKTKERVLLSN